MSVLFTVGIMVLFEESIPVFFQIPQYLLMSIAETLLSVTALEFAYVNAPDQMVPNLFLSKFGKNYESLKKRL